MFQGLYTALITPFNDDGSIDLESLKRLVKRQFDSGVDGMILFGTSGEGATVTEEEKELVVKYVLALVNGFVEERKLSTNSKQYKPKIIVGTGTNCTTTTIANSQRAEQLGADGVMIVAPYYNRPSQEGLYAHYKSVNDAINLPIMLYNVPTRTAVNIDDSTLLKLTSLRNIHAIKDYDSLRPIRLYVNWAAARKNTAAKNFFEDAYSSYESFVTDSASKFTILAGDDVNSLSIYINGGHGCVSVASNILPRICRDLHSAVKSLDMQRAKVIHAHLHAIYNALFCEVNPVPVKYFAYKMQLIKSPVVRQPLYQLLDSNKAKIDSIIERYHLRAEALL